MKRNCNLELRLVTPCVYAQSSDHYSASMVDGGRTTMDNKQQFSNFHSARLAVCDATELQAREILWLASREVEERSPAPGGASDCYYSPKLTSAVYSPSSMKGSLKSFLEKRKSRTQATSPYPITPKHAFP